MLEFQSPNRGLAELQLSIAVADNLDIAKLCAKD
jgi:hypothetical protein